MIDVKCPVHGLRPLASEEYYAQLERVGPWLCPVSSCGLQCKGEDGSLQNLPRTMLGADRVENEMENTMTEVTTDTVPNGKTKEPSLVSVIRAEWIANGSVEPPTSQIQPLVNAWRASEKMIASAELAIAKAKEEGYAAALELAKRVGCTAIKFDGVRHEFSSREGKVFLRVKGDRADEIEIK